MTCNGSTTRPSGRLAYAVRRLEDRPIGLVLAARDRLDASVDARLVELLDAVPQGRRDRVELGPMPLAALHRLFLARFGRSFPRLTLVRIEEASAGNPFYALEMARAVIDGGLELGPDGHVPIPERLGACCRHALRRCRRRLDRPWCWWRSPPTHRSKP